MRHSVLAATAVPGSRFLKLVTRDPATVAGNTVTLTGGDGVVTIQATQAGNGTYLPRLPINQSFTVRSSFTAQTITFPAIGHAPPGRRALHAGRNGKLRPRSLVRRHIWAGDRFGEHRHTHRRNGLGHDSGDAGGNGTYAAATP